MLWRITQIVINTKGRKAPKKWSSIAKIYIETFHLCSCLVCSKLYQSIAPNEHLMHDNIIYIDCLIQILVLMYPKLSNWKVPRE